MSHSPHARQWQPIETAPKDGTLVLFWSPTASLPYIVPLRGGEACALLGYTHWMPLPDPPHEAENVDNN